MTLQSRPMAFLDTLLTAIVSADGDTLVMRVGERPCVRGAAGAVELSSQPLTLQTMTGLVAQLLPPEPQRILLSLGAVEHELMPVPAMGADRFTVVAARGGDDMWIELRRHRRNGGGDRVRRHAGVRRDRSAESSPAPVDDLAAAESENRRAAAAGAPTSEPPPDRRVPAAAEPLRDARTRRSDLWAAHVSAAPAAASPSAHADHHRRSGDPPPSSSVPSGAATVRPDMRRLIEAFQSNATVVYLTAGSPPSSRVDGCVRLLEAQPAWSAEAIRSLVHDLQPDDRRRAAEWEAELAGVGRLRCLSFEDAHGPGLVLERLIVAAPTAERLRLPAAMQALALEADGLVLVSSAPRQGRSTVLHALVDLVNRQRSDYVIVVERQRQVAHLRGAALVSGREARGRPEDLGPVLRRWLAERPDVLALDDLLVPDLLDVVLEAAESGVLVLATASGATTAAALTALLGALDADRRAETQRRLSAQLRGCISQVVLRRRTGGRVAAREWVPWAVIADALNDKPVEALPEAITGSRHRGARPLNDALIQLVRSGEADVREAWRKSTDRAAFLEMLRSAPLDAAALALLEADSDADSDADPAPYS